MQTASLAKITRPKQSGIFGRDRLFRLIDKERSKPLVWVAAPAGSGKTTLVASYLDSRKLPCLWYQVDEGDGDVASFFYYMGMAAKRAAPRYKKPLPLLTPEYLMGIPVFTRRYFEELFRRLKPPFIIVLDNYQDAPLDSGFHDMLVHGLDAAPEGITVLVLSRLDPPPQLARLHANNRLQLIGWDDVRFTREESGELLKTQGCGKVTKEIADLLYKRTQGWAAGLMLLREVAGTETPGRQSIDSRLQPEVFNYFAGEVFDKLESETGDFLLMTSFLPSMTARMAVKMTDQDNAGRILADLNLNHFFTEKHETAEPSYLYHALFREFLLTKMKESLNSEGILRVQNRAAAILEEAGQVEDAASIYREAQNWEKYIPLILGHAQALITQGRSATLSEWLAAVPKQIAETIPWLQYWIGACKMPFNPVESQRYFEHAFGMFKKSDDLAGQFLAWSGIADSIYFAGNNYVLLDPWFDAFDELLFRHPDFPSQEIEILVSNSIFGALLLRRPQQEKLAFWEQRLNRLLPLIIDDRLRITSASFLLVYYMWNGDAAKASQLMDTLRSPARADDVTPLAFLSLNITEAIYCWGMSDFRRCHEIVAKGLKTAEITGVHLFDNLLLSQGVYGPLSSGDLPAGADLLNKMKSMQGSTRRFDVAQYSYLAGWEAALRDDLAGALEHTQTSLSLTESAGIPFPLALNHIAMAQVFTARKKYHEALQHIGSARRINQDMRSGLLEFMCLLQEAWLALEQNDETKCLPSLQAAFALWKKLGFANFAWWTPHLMTRLCAKALEAGIEVEFVQGVIRKRHLRPEASMIVGERWPWPIKIYTLGRFEIEKDGRQLQFSGKVQKKPHELLKAIIAFGGLGVREDMVIDALWPDAEGDAARVSFKSTLHRLRQLLGNDEFIQLQDNRISLDKRYSWVDAWAFERMVENAEFGMRNSELRENKKTNRNKESEVNHLEKALQMYQGHFLSEEEGKPWAASFRERLRSKYLHTVSSLGDYWQEQGKASQKERAKLAMGKAIECYQRGLEIDDVAEEFYQNLMLCNHKIGRKAEAVKVYQRCKNALAAAFGIGPSEETESIYKMIVGK